SPHFLRVQHLDVSVDAQALKVSALLCGSPRPIALRGLNRTSKSFLDCFPSGFRTESLLGSGDEILIQLYRRSAHHACILTEHYVHQTCAVNPARDIQTRRTRLPRHEVRARRAANGAPRAPSSRRATFKKGGGPS